MNQRVTAAAPAACHGRDRELAAWRAVLDDDAGQTVLIVGQPGMGKTVLMRRMLLDLHTPGRARRVGGYYQIARSDTLAIIASLVLDGIAAKFDADGSLAARFDLQGLVAGLSRDRLGLAEALRRLSRALRGDDRAVLAFDPRTTLAPDTGEGWEMLLESLPPRIKIVIAQRPDDQLAQSRSLAALVADGHIVRIPDIALGPLDATAQTRTIIDATPRIALPPDDIARAVARYDGHPYATTAALALLAAGTAPSALPADPTPTAILDEQWRRIARGGAGTHGAEAIRLFAAFAVLDTPSYAEAILAVSGLDSPTGTSLLVDSYLATLLEKLDDRTQIYHSTLSELILAELPAPDLRGYHRAAMTYYREQFRESRRTGGTSLGALSGILHHTRHALAADGPEAMAVALDECMPILLYWNRDTEFYRLADEVLDTPGQTPRGTCRALTCRGIYQRTRWNVDGALADLHSALDGARRHGLALDSLHPAYELLRTLLKLGRDHHDVYIAVRDLEPPSDLMRFANGLGQIADLLFDYDRADQAVALYTRLLDLEIKLERRDVIATTFRRIEEIHRRTNDTARLRELEQRMTAYHRIDVTRLAGQIDLALLSIREDEFAAVLQRFAPARSVSGNRRYEIGVVPTRTGQHYRVAMVRPVDQGQGAAQDVARDIIEDLKPGWLLLVGIAGAVPSDDFCLGDVVCATRVHDFTVRASRDDTPDQFNLRGGPMHREVESLLGSLPAIVAQLGDWSSEESIGMAKLRQDVPAPTNAQFYGSKQWREHTHQKLTTHFPRTGKLRPPLVTAQSMASSDALIKSTDLVAAWQKTARAVAAVEMELGGVYLAARRRDREYPILAIRGISDVIGFKRANAWTRYACHSAAAFAFALVRSGAIPGARPGNGDDFLAGLKTADDD